MKDTTGQYASIDVHLFQKQGLLEPGGHWLVSGVDSDLSFEIWCMSDPHRISIKSTRPGNWQACFDLLRTRCNYGGFRYWFKCPSCQKRKGKLYQHGGQFKCRTCADLTYYSVQSRSHYDKIFGFLAHDWKEDNRLDREYKRINQQKRRQYTYRGETIKRLRYRNRRRHGINYALMSWMDKHG